MSLARSLSLTLPFVGGIRQSVNPQTQRSEATFGSAPSMIHPRTLNGAGLGIGVRYRVSACRKRLRVSRTYRANRKIERDEECTESDSGVTLGRDNPGVITASSPTEEEAENK